MTEEEIFDLVRRNYCEANKDYLAEQIAKAKIAASSVMPIDYEACSNAMLRMWMEKVLTDSEYNRIMDKLNKAHEDGRL